MTRRCNEWPPARPEICENAAKRFVYITKNMSELQQKCNFFKIFSSHDRPPYCIHPSWLRIHFFYCGTTGRHDVRTKPTNETYLVIKINFQISRSSTMNARQKNNFNHELRKSPLELYYYTAGSPTSHLRRHLTETYYQ